MYEKNLTKEEIKSIKRGRAYKNWNKTTWIIKSIFLIWCFGGIPLAHMNSVTRVIYTIGLVVCLIVLFYAIVFTSWKCPACKGKLPSKNVSGGTASACMPVLVKKCPHCGADLTQ